MVKNEKENTSEQPEGACTYTVLLRLSRLGVSTSSSSDDGSVRFFLGETWRAVYRSDMVCWSRARDEQVGTAVVQVEHARLPIIYATGAHVIRRLIWAFALSISDYTSVAGGSYRIN